MPTKKYHHGDLKNALIKAGVEILSKEGVEGLSLRKVAKRAGVSHSAPYAHFKDRQSLIAAISTEGFRKLYNKLDAVVSVHADDPVEQLVEAAWAYIRFAMDNPDTFKIMFSGVLEKEKDYPSFVEISGQTFERVVEIVQGCQKAGVLPSEPSELVAVSAWSQVHGLISLALEGQIPHRVLDRFDLREILLFTIRQMSYER
jgi:AcrR family transcriptional regulator